MFSRNIISPKVVRTLFITFDGSCYYSMSNIDCVCSYDYYHINNKFELNRESDNFYLLFNNTLLFPFSDDC